MEDRDWEPMPLWASIIGASSIGAIQALLACLTGWLSRFIPGLPSWALGDLFQSFFLLWMGITAVTTIVLRHFARRAKNNSFASVTQMVYGIVFSSLIAAIIGEVSLPGDRAGLTFSACTLITLTGFALATQEWKTHMTSDEFHETWGEFKDMTRDHFADDAAEIRRMAREKGRARWEKEQERERRRRARDAGH